MAVPPLPKIMVAPNGARRRKKDHPALPITIPEIVQTAIECETAGADGIHLHVRDEDGNHTLDVGLYAELLTELDIKTPHLFCQVTTEAVGQYSPLEQRALITNLKPRCASISVSEMHADDEGPEIIAFYNWCIEQEISVQHILYGADDLKLFDTLLENCEPTLHAPQALFVLGRYVHDQESKPEHLEPFTSWLTDQERELDWAVCAFGKGETACLLKAHELGGKMRIGFENSIWNADGSIATDNAQRINMLTKLL